MSTTVYMIFDRKVAGFTQNDRCTLAYVFFDARFRKVAKRLGVAPLTECLSDVSLAKHLRYNPISLLPGSDQN